MAGVTWRRFHGDKFIAHVRPLEESPGFEVAVWSASAPDFVTTTRRAFRGLDSAKAAADALARSVFRHKCDFTRCGEWMVWTA
jgi:hypothetical protein